MALENVITTLVLDVIDHDQTQAVVKSIALDSKTRYVQATIVQHGLDYDVDPSETVIICPIHLNFDTDYSFNMTTTTKNGHDSGTVPYCSDDTHPSASGFYQISDSYFACIKAN